LHERPELADKWREFNILRAMEMSGFGSGRSPGRQASALPAQHCSSRDGAQIFFGIARRLGRRSIFESRSVSVANVFATPLIGRFGRAHSRITAD
jgi:hypothetical protein